MTPRTATTTYKYGAAFPRGEGRAKVRDLHERGLTPREIARLLDISVQGVQYHLRRIEEEKAS